VTERNASLELKVAFEAAKEQFLAELTSDERSLFLIQFSSCSSAQSLLDEVQKFEVIANGKQRGLRLARKIKSFGENLEPYFKIIEIVCGAHPEYANFAWAALRLILQVGLMESHF